MTEQRNFTGVTQIKQDSKSARKLKISKGRSVASNSKEAKACEFNPATLQVLALLAQMVIRRSRRTPQWTSFMADITRQHRASALCICRRICSLFAERMKGIRKYSASERLSHLGVGHCYNTFLTYLLYRSKG